MAWIRSMGNPPPAIIKMIEAGVAVLPYTGGAQATVSGIRVYRTSGNSYEAKFNIDLTNMDNVSCSYINRTGSGYAVIAVDGVNVGSNNAGSGTILASVSAYTGTHEVKLFCSEVNAEFTATEFVASKS